MNISLLLILVFRSPVFPLTLSETVHEALKNSPQVRQAALALDKALLEEPELLALTDPVFRFQASSAKDEAPRSAPAIQGTFSKAETVEAAISQQLLTGTQSRLFFRSQKLESPAIFRPLDPTSDFRFGFEIRQPLLRHFWGRPDKAKRKQARSGAAAARQGLEQSKQEQAVRAALAYLNLYVAQQLIGIRRAARDDAQRLRDTYADKRRYGLIEASDLWQAEASVKVQDTELRLAQSELRQAEISLREVLRRSENDFAPGALSLPRPPDEPLPSEDQAWALALAHRGDWLQASHQLEQAQSFVRVENLNTLPDLALVGSYSYAGLATRFGPSWSDASGFNHPVRMAGLELAIPFKSAREKVRRRQAQLNLEFAQSRLGQLGSQIQKETASALESLKLAQERRQAYQSLLEAERQKLAAAQEDFRRGRATTDILIRFQADIHRTQILLLKAEADTLIGWAHLGYSTGQLLDYLDEMTTKEGGE